MGLDLLGEPDVAYEGSIEDQRYRTPVRMRRRMAVAGRSGRKVERPAAHAGLRSEFKSAVRLRERA